MPQYNGSGSGSLTPNTVPPSALWPGDELYLFGTAPYIPGNPTKATDSNVVTEAVTIGERSIAVALAPRPGGGAAPGIMVQVVASANPGVAEIDVQDAAVDADGAYLTPTSSTAYKITTFALINDGSGRYIGWTELQPEGGRFVSLKVILNPNAVTFTAKLTYV